MKRPNPFRTTFAIASVTFSAITRDKVLYNIFFCSFFLFCISILASQLMILHPERVLMNFGMTAFTASNGMIGIFTGASLINKEIERRTIYVALCHPIQRLHFIIGKFLGLGLVITVNAALFVTIYLLLLKSYYQNYSFLHLTLIYGLFLSYLQSLVLASIAILFSTMTTSSLAVIFSICIFLIGQNSSQLLMIAEKSSVQSTKLLLQACSFILPDLEKFNLSLKITYALPVHINQILSTSLYSILVIFISCWIAGWILKYKEI